MTNSYYKKCRPHTPLATHPLPPRKDSCPQCSTASRSFRHAPNAADSSLTCRALWQASISFQSHHHDHHLHDHSAGLRLLWHSDQANIKRSQQTLLIPSPLTHAVSGSPSPLQDRGRVPIRSQAESVRGARALSRVMDLSRPIRGPPAALAQTRFWVQAQMTASFIHRRFQ